MRASLLTVLATAGFTTASVLLPRIANKGVCECPTFGPYGTCILYNGLAVHDQPGSAWCGPPDDKWSDPTYRWAFACLGTYDNPNCNACAQTVLGNIPQPGRTTECTGAQFCSNDNGLNYHVCATGEKPFIPVYATQVDYNQDVSAAVVASGTFDVNWLLTTLPQWFKQICHNNACEINPSSAPNQDLSYAGPGLGLSTGNLELLITESQFDNADELNAMVELATVALLRATKCEVQTFRDKCTSIECDDTPQKITVCHGPSDINVAKRYYDAQGNTALHSILHFTLKWDDRSVPFSCDVLEQPLDTLNSITGLSDKLPDISKYTGGIQSLCKGIAALFNGK